MKKLIKRFQFGSKDGLTPHLEKYSRLRYAP
jgi:hypothetical protein